MELDKLFEAIDSEILNEEMKKSLQESFDTAVELKSAELVAERTQTLEDEIHQKHQDILEAYQVSTDKRISEYLDLAIKEFLEENKLVMEGSIKEERVSALLEGFDSILFAGGVDLKKIADYADDSIAQEKIEELTTKLNKVVESNMELKEANADLFKSKVISEVSEGLSVIQKDKLEKLASVVEFTQDDSYKEKLETLKSTVVGSAEEVHESEVKKELNENAPSWKRFVK